MKNRGLNLSKLKEKIFSNERLFPESFSFVVFFSMGFEAITGFVRQELRTAVFQHIARVPGSPMFVSRVSASSFVEELAHPRGILWCVFRFPGTRVFVDFLPRGCDDGFSRARHILSDKNGRPLGCNLLG